MFIITCIVLGSTKAIVIKSTTSITRQRAITKIQVQYRVVQRIACSAAYLPQPGEDWSIVLGNAEAGNIITMATNPYCQPCAYMHKTLEDLMEQNDNIQLRIIFTTENNDEDNRTQIGRHFMALNE